MDRAHSFQDLWGFIDIDVDEESPSSEIADPVCLIEEALRSPPAAGSRTKPVRERGQRATLARRRERRARGRRARGRRARGRRSPHPARNAPAQPAHLAEAVHGLRRARQPARDGRRGRGRRRRRARVAGRGRRRARRVQDRPSRRSTAGPRLRARRRARGVAARVGLPRARRRALGSARRGAAAASEVSGALAVLEHRGRRAAARGGRRRRYALPALLETHRLLEHLVHALLLDATLAEPLLGSVLDGGERAADADAVASVSRAPVEPPCFKPPTMRDAVFREPKSFFEPEPWPTRGAHSPKGSQRGPPLPDPFGQRERRPFPAGPGVRAHSP